MTTVSWPRNPTLSTKVRLSFPEAGKGLHRRPPIGKSRDIEDDILVGRQGDEECNRREIQIGEAQSAGDETGRAFGLHRELGRLGAVVNAWVCVRLRLAP